MKFEKPGKLLVQLRDLLGTVSNVSVGLAKATKQIAKFVSCDVCTIYVHTSDNMLELYATYGLDLRAVHKTILKFDQGLVGYVAKTGKPLNLAKASSHPVFSYFPETREERFSSFLGVPVLRGGLLLGVLVIQHRHQYIYSSDDIEAFKLVAMFLAEIIALADSKVDADHVISTDLQKTMKLSGASLSTGINVGRVLLHEPRVDLKNLLSDNCEDEINRLRKSLYEMHFMVDDLIAGNGSANNREINEVMEAYRMMAHDQGWIQRIEKTIMAGLTAEAAVERVQSETRVRMNAIPDSYMRERLHDLDDISFRLQRILLGSSGLSFKAEAEKEDFVLVAQTLGAGDVLFYGSTRIRAIVLEEGSSAAHFNIIARILGIPVVGQLRGVVSLVQNKDMIAVDGDAGTVVLRPDAETNKDFENRIKRQKWYQQYYLSNSALPAKTIDGKEITVMFNGGLDDDSEQVAKSGACGIGLFRTELLFLTSSRLPTLREQIEYYSHVYGCNLPVYFRTLDLGGDKIPGYLHKEVEMNPAMGWRAIRWALDRAGFFRWQARALYRASAEKELNVVFPMVATVSEFCQARTMFNDQCELLRHRGYVPPKKVRYGCMLEVPGLFFDLDNLLKELDFVSLGTNDLAQFFYAADRSNVRLLSQYSCYDAPFIRMLKQLQVKSCEYNKEVTVCGEMAGTDVGALLLIGLGFERLSMPATSIGPIKSIVRGVSYQELVDMVHNIMIQEMSSDKAIKLLSDLVNNCIDIKCKIN